MKMMKNKIFLTLALGVLTTGLFAQVDRSKRPSAAEERVINISDPTVYKLENGLTVILVEDHNTPKISYNLSIDIPVFNEVAFGAIGVSQMAGDLLNSGTTKLSKDELDKKVDLLGATFNASSSGFFASSLTKHTDKMLEIASDVVMNPAFPQSELERLKKTYKSGIESSKTDPGQMASNVASVANFGKAHPYGEVMTENDVDAMTLDHVKMYHKTFFIPNISYLVVVGDITIDELKPKIEKAFGKWQKKQAPQIPVAKVKMPSENRVYFAPKKGAVQSEIRVTFPVDIKPGAEDEMAAKLMNSVLGGGVFSGRLMMNLREDKAYTYGCRSRLSSDEEIGSFSTSGSFRNEVTDSAIVEIMSEINGMISNEITDREILLAKQGMKGNFVRGLESPATIAYLALRRIKYNLPDDYYKTYLQRLDKITKDDLKAMAKKYLKPEAANIVVVGNEEIADKLTQFDKQGKLIKMDYKGDLIKDLKPAPEGMTAQNVFEKFITAKFGNADAKKLAKLRKKTKSISMEYEMVMAQMPNPLTMTEFKEKPNKFVQIVKMGMMAVNKTFFDGEKGGTYNMQIQKDFTAEEIKDFQESNVIFDDIDLLDPDKTNATLVGIEEVDGKDTYKVKVVESEDETKTYYFDTETGLPVKIETESKEGEKTNFSSTSISNWQDQDGIKFVSEAEVGIGGMTFQQKLKKVELNVKVDQNLYSK